MREITSADPLAEERGYFLRAAQAGGLVVSLKVDPGQVGSNNFEVGLGSEFGRGAGQARWSKCDPRAYDFFSNRAAP